MRTIPNNEIAHLVALAKQTPMPGSQRLDALAAEIHAGRYHPPARALAAAMLADLRGLRLKKPIGQTDDDKRGE
jgi:hypothetical protein